VSRGLLIAVVCIGAANAVADDVAEPAVNLRHVSIPKQASGSDGLAEIQVVSTLDQSQQPSLFWAPATATTDSTPLLVLLHTWSGDYRQDKAAWHEQARARGWIYLQPDFRGPNNRPEACGSKPARQDVLDAVEHVKKNYRVDESRIYLAGSSGGGHMAMLMAGYHPREFSAVSAWVGISDLAEWYRFHVKDGQPQGYAKMVAASCGGAPGDSEQIDAEYRARSPIFHLHRVGSLPLDLCAGVQDGHTGSVPIHHTLRAFNTVAATGGYQQVSDAEIDELWTNHQLSNPRPDDVAEDSEYGRAIMLRRTAGPSRVTIFDGGHEGLPEAACHWLTRQTRRFGASNAKPAAAPGNSTGCPTVRTPTHSRLVTTP